MTSIPKKPLELTVFHREEDGDYQHPVTCLWVSALKVDDEMEAKRFSESELSAEFYRARWTGLMHESRGACLTDEHREKIRTVERFATLPPL